MCEGLGRYAPPVTSRDDTSAARGLVTTATRQQLFLETVLVLGVSLGSSAIYAVLTIIRKLTAGPPLSEQTTTMNNAVTPDRPWLDLAYQLAGIGLGVLPAFLALYLLMRDDGAAVRRIGADLRRPGFDLARGGLLAAAIGIPGLALYFGARALGLNTSIAAANLEQTWWTIPVLVLAAAQNAILEEVVMVGYLFTRWSQARWSFLTIALTSALIRGTYHLYQGFGGFVGNIAMGLILAWAYRRWGRVGPLVVAHTILDIVAFVGYSALVGHVSWL